MNVLYIPQFSMVNEGVHYIDKDGNFIVLKSIIQYLNNTNNGIEYNVTVLIPKRYSQTKFFSDIKKLTGDKVKVQFAKHNFTYPIDDRYNFNFADFEKLQYKKYDLIFNNIPEISRNLRALYKQQDVKIVSLHHFPDYIKLKALTTALHNGNLYSYFFRQLDGFISSDMNFFNCYPSMGGFFDDIEYLNLDADKIGLDYNKASYISYTNISFEKIKNKKFDEITAIFPSRVTASMYTNWHKVIELFLNENITGRVILTNPSYLKGIGVIKEAGYLTNYKEDVIQLSAKNSIPVISLNNGKVLIVNKNLTRTEYKKLSKLSHVALNLYEDEYYGGIAIREIITWGSLLPLTLNLHQFSTWYLGVDIDKLNTVSDLDVDFYNSYINMSNEDKEKIFLNIEKEDIKNHQLNFNLIFNGK